LSAAVIVRNEQRNVRLCLESIRSLVDEIVVADTGATDFTRQIALSFDAQVIDVPWNDDFAAARNEALRHTTGDWTLSIDADGTSRPFPREQLQRLFSDESMAGYYGPFCRRKNLTPNWQLKLFRRNRKLTHMCPFMRQSLHRQFAPSPDLPSERATGCSNTPAMRATCTTSTPETRAFFFANCRAIRTIPPKSKPGVTSPTSTRHLAETDPRKLPGCALLNSSG
jgi:hypothetical protein